MITYLDAIASPTHGIPASDYYSGWVGEAIGNHYANGKSYFGIKLDVGENTGGPLFFTDYSFMGFDPHGIHDRFTDYFDNNRSQALINQQYCIHNAHRWQGYGEDTWGLTAVDGPGGYVPYEPTFDLDDGTTNELVTTILTFGEGLHNNHHRFPRDAYLSHAWYEIDINGLIIRGLGKLGIVHDIFDARTRHPGGNASDAEAL